MFEEIFSHPAALRRHREGLLVSERREYLKYLKDRGAASGTVVKALATCAVTETSRTPSSEEKPTWRNDPDLMEFLNSL